MLETTCMSMPAASMSCKPLLQVPGAARERAIGAASHVEDGKVVVDALEPRPQRWGLLAHERHRLLGKDVGVNIDNGALRHCQVPWVRCLRKLVGIHARACARRHLGHVPALPEHALAARADHGRGKHQDEHDGENQEGGADRAVDEHRRVAVRDHQCAAQVLLDQGTQDEAEAAAAPARSARR